MRFNERDASERCAGVGQCTVGAFARVEAARAVTGESLTYSQFTTLAAVELFLAQDVDVLVLEVGLGGQLDAVNLYDPTVSVITGVALDHQDLSG